MKGTNEVRENFVSYLVHRALVTVNIWRVGAW
jgi:hypothetical protein